ncbi:neurogenic locus notch homolog protein 1-like [Mya arenaria]|uniref:neurogenic locus notch homolog protein 1-like n=1 Tax=Mya arenaria TaxID=6604 RepID=UPI0022E8156F|nr:neurogenic locus notch homolog protein 1-like [Mya arenaria]
MCIGSNVFLLHLPACARGYYCHEGETQYRPSGHLCRPGKYCFQGIQRLCPAGTFQPYQGQTTCFPCPKGSYCAGEGQTVITGACRPGWHCGEQSTNPQPTPCRPGHFCPYGYEIPCGLGLYQPQEYQRGCIPCPPSFYCSVKGSTAVTGACQTGCCLYGFHASPNDCDPPNTECARGQVGGTCKPCPVGKYCSYKDIPEDQAPSCEDGYYCDGGDTYPNPMEKICPVGHYCIKGISQPCPELTKYQDEVGQAFCKSCPAGSICNRVGRTSLCLGQMCGCDDEGCIYHPPQNCPELKFCYEGRAYFCPFGYQSDGVTCVACPLHRECTKSVDVGNCVNGYWCGWSGRTAASLREPCLEIERKVCVDDNWYSIDCLPCPAGEYCQGIGLVTPSGVCSPGYVCPERSEQPQPCTAGYYCPTTRMTESDLVPCPPGFFCPEGSSQPSPCAPGTYAPGQNHSTCIICPVGFYCIEQAVTMVPCPWKIYCKLGSSAPVCDLLPHGSEGTNVSISSSKDKGHQYMARTTVTTLKAVCVDCHLPVVSYTWSVRHCLQSLSMEECRNCDFHVLQHSSNLDTFTLDRPAKNIAHWDYLAVYVTVTFNDGSQNRAYQTWKSITVANDTHCHTVPYSGLTVVEQFDILCDKLPVLDPVIVQYKLSILTDGIEVMANIGSSCNMTDLVLISGKPEEDFILQLHYAVTYYGDVVWETRFQAQVKDPPALTEEMVHKIDDVTNELSFNDSDSLYNSLHKLTSCVHMINLDEAPDPSGQPKHTIQTAEVRGHVINKLSEIDAKDAQIVNALSLTLSTVVKKPDQITSKAKTQSVSIYSKLVKAYKNSSAEVTQTDLAVTARVCAMTENAAMKFPEELNRATTERTMYAR